MYEALIAELEVQDAQPIENDGVPYTIRELPFITLRLTEPEILSLRYQDEKSAMAGAERLKGVKAQLNMLCANYTKAPNTRQLCAHLKDSRCFLIHMLVNHMNREILFMSYTTYASATEQFRNDMAFLCDLKEYLRRKSELYSYSIRSVDTFGVVYHIEKVPQHEKETATAPNTTTEKPTQDIKSGDAD